MSVLSLELKETIAADIAANKFERMRLKVLNIRYQYLRLLRTCEYCSKITPPSLVNKAKYWLFRFLLYRVSVKSGIQIPINTFSKGLYLPHHGTIVVNETARFGTDCVIQAGVNISAGVKGGNHIYLASGCKIMKNVTIADDVIIGANAVVTKDILEPNVVVAGVPAKIISRDGFKNRQREI